MKTKNTPYDSEFVSGSNIINSGAGSGGFTQGTGGSSTGGSGSGTGTGGTGTGGSGGGTGTGTGTGSGTGGSGRTGTGSGGGATGSTRQDSYTSARSIRQTIHLMSNSKSLIELFRECFSLRPVYYAGGQGERRGPLDHLEFNGLGIS